MPEDFVSTAGDIFSDMRLLIEGAIVLFENDASSIMHLTKGKEHYQARYSFNTIGAALYQLREKMNTLEWEHFQESERQLAAMQGV